MSIKIGLGSAQWGMNYGISNSIGQTESTELVDILAVAKTNKIKIIDTAFSYGKAEEAIGECNQSDFKIVTKTRKFISNYLSESDGQQLKNDFSASLKKLKAKNIYTLMIHDSYDLLKQGSKYIIDSIKELKDEGLVQKVGISVYDINIIKEISHIFLPEIVQLPFNIFDRRAINSNLIKSLKDHSVEIHARSIFLQGLLLMQREEIPKYFEQWSDLLDKWDYSVSSSGLSKIEACLKYALSFNEIDICILGVQSKAQLIECLNIVKTNNFFEAKGLECKDNQLIEPQRWKI